MKWDILLYLIPLKISTSQGQKQFVATFLTYHFWLQVFSGSRNILAKLIKYANAFAFVFVFERENVENVEDLDTNGRD